MSRRVLLLILVALLVVLAGCNGLGGDSSPPDRDVYDVDDPVQSSLDGTGDGLSNGELVPGLTADGIENRTALLDGHDSVLEDTTYSLFSQQSGQNSTSRITIERTSMVNESANRHHQIETSQGTMPAVLGPEPDVVEHEAIEYWQDENDTLQRTELSNGTVEYNHEHPYVLDSGTLYLHEFTQVDDLTVEAFDPTDESVALDDDPMYYSLTGELNETNDDISSDLEELTVGALVRNDGLISEVFLGYRTTIDGEQIVTSMQTRTSVRDGTTVDRPEWYEEALEEVSDKDEWEREQYPPIDDENGGDDTQTGADDETVDEPTADATVAD